MPTVRINDNLTIIGKLYYMLLQVYNVTSAHYCVRFVFCIGL